MSNYEQYAEKKQPELLKQTRTLDDCIEKLKSSKNWKKKPRKKKDNLFYYFRKGGKKYANGTS